MGLLYSKNNKEWKNYAPHDEGCAITAAPKEMGRICRAKNLRGPNRVSTYGVVHRPQVRQGINRRGDAVHA